MKRDVVLKEIKVLKIVRYGYSVLLLIFTGVFIIPAISEGCPELYLPLIVIFAMLFALLWIPFKKENLIVKSVVTFIGIVITAAIGKDSLSIIESPQLYPQLQIESLTRYLTENLLMIVLFGIPAVIVWIPFKRRPSILSGIIAAACCYMVYRRIITIIFDGNI